MDQESNEILEWRQDDNDTEILKGIDELKQLLPQNLSQVVYEQFLDLIKKSFNAPVGIKELDIKCLDSEDSIKIYKKLCILRKLMLQHHDDDKLDPVIQADKNLVPKIINLIESSDIQLIKFEAIYVLLALIDRDYFLDQIIQNNGIKVLLAQLESQHLQISTQACTALGNIVLYGHEFSILIQKNGGIELILNILQQLQQPRHIDICCWSLNNMISLSILDIKKDTVERMYLVLCNLIKQHDDELSLLGCFKILKESLPFTKQTYKILIESQAINNLLKLILSQNQKISKASFELISGLLYSNVELLDQNISKECLGLMNKLLQQKKSYIEKGDVLYCISQFCGGTQVQQKLLFENKTMISQIIKFVKNNQSDEAMEIVLLLVKLSKINDNEIIKYLINEGIIQVLIQGLESEDEDDIEEIINALLNIIKLQSNNQKQKILNKKQVEAIKKVQNHKSKTIKNHIKQLILLLE